jgi:hypothetical protein
LKKFWSLTMPTHEPHERPGVDSPGYEVSDVNVNGVVVFLAALLGFVGVFFVFCFGMGKVINTAIEKSDGPPNKWNQIGVSPEKGKRQDLTSNAVMEQQQLNQMVQRFPTPRLQTDDGNLDIAEMHVREDLLLDHYSWVDRSSGKVRIPISKAMELIAGKLPVAPAEQTTDTEMVGDNVPVVTAPLTDGFARTGYEQQYLETLEQQRERGEKPEQASLNPNH